MSRQTGKQTDKRTGEQSGGRQINIQTSVTYTPSMQGEREGGILGVMVIE